MSVTAFDHSPPVDHPVLAIEHLSKTFPGTRALDDMSLDVRRGEIHALVGQNGSGKSTFVKILAGYHKADPGYVAYLNADPLDLSTESGKRHEELRFVHQDLGLVLELSAVDNLALRGEFIRSGVGLVNWRRQRAFARELLARFNLDIDVTKSVGELTPVQRTIVAIAAALAGWTGGEGVLVLDEPTAVLPPTEVDRLHETVEQVRASGTSVLYISHRLDEIFRLADRVTVLRGGRVVASPAVSEVNAQSLAQLMVGTGVDAKFRAGVPEPVGAPTVLTARDIRGKFLNGIDLDLRAGEIVGLAGLPGSGSGEFPYAVVGADELATGKVRLGDGEWIAARHASTLQLPMVPADRAREAIVGSFSVRENLSVAVLSRLKRNGLLSLRQEEAMAQQWIRATAVKVPSSADPIEDLSGGNQQKVVISRGLALESGVLILCEPTAGVDVGARQAIYELIAEKARDGLAVLVSSTDTGDLLALCTRVLVFVGGHVRLELTGDQISEESILNAMEEAS